MPRVSEQVSCDNPKVSVVMITYNHEKFIAQAIESVLMQETVFPVELVIGEDCSTDGTRTIVQEYAGKYPNVIRALLPNRNLGMHTNFLAMHAACCGDYFAYLEGDDYWTSEHKLRKQVNLLEEHSDYAMCFHRVKIFRDQPREDVGESPPPKLRTPFQTITTLLEGCFLMTGSVLLRKTCYPDFPPGFTELAMGDWPTWILAARNGKIGYIDDLMGCYRLHAGGVHSGLCSNGKRLAGEALMLAWVAQYLPPQQRRKALTSSRTWRKLAMKTETQEQIIDKRDNSSRKDYALAVARGFMRNPSIIFWRPYFSLAAGLLVGHNVRNLINSRRQHAQQR